MFTIFLLRTLFRADRIKTKLWIENVGVVTTIQITRGECTMRKGQRFKVRDYAKRANQSYFGMKLGHQGKPCAPHKVS